MLYYHQPFFKEPELDNARLWRYMDLAQFRKRLALTVLQ
jgi:hypothetical protein